MQTQEPHSVRIAPLAQAERDARVLLGAVEAWQATAGFVLPDVYRRFLIDYNGGHVYPNLFDPILQGGKTYLGGWPTACDPLYDFATVEEHWADRQHFRGLPEGLLLIGGDGLGLEVCLSLRAPDFGVVFSYVPAAVPWSATADTDEWISRQADDFPAFIASLFDTPDRQGWQQWRTPRIEATAVPLILHI